MNNKFDNTSANSVDFFLYYENVNTKLVLAMF